MIYHSGMSSFPAITLVTRVNADADVLYGLTVVIHISTV